MKKNGFTLVEILAILAILGLIILLSVPLVVGIIDNSQKSAFENDVKTIVETVKLEYETLSLNEDYPCLDNIDDSESCKDDSNYRILPKYVFGKDSATGKTGQAHGKFGFLHISGDIPSGGSVYLRSTDGVAESGYFKKYDTDKDSDLSVVVRSLVSKDGKWCADKEYGSDKITIKKSSDDPIRCVSMGLTTSEQGILAKEIYYNPKSKEIESLISDGSVDDIDFASECKKLYNDNKLSYSESVQCALDVIGKSLD